MQWVARCVAMSYRRADDEGFEFILWSHPMVMELSDSASICPSGGIRPCLCSMRIVVTAARNSRVLLETDGSRWSN
jgi:hypothetical protein